MHEDEIFTAEQFKAQAAELRAAVAELQRRDEQTIDPQNPFENETEFHHYNQNYADVVPQIQIPGCKIPLKPNGRERSRIRKYYNIAGLCMTGHMLLSNLLAILITSLFCGVQTVLDKAACGGELPSNYDLLVDEYFWASSSATALNVIVFLICNAGFAILGCKWAKIPIPTLFRTKGLTPGRVVIYICIAIGLQAVCGYLASWITEFLSAAGVTAYDPDMSAGTDIKNMVLTCIYGCIVAPVTEELLFRGFAMKTLSRVSQRFGIIMSAVLFGLWHENIAQFVLAFFVGIFMGYLTVKHDSILPAILCHMAVNTAAQLFEIADTYGFDLMYQGLDMLYIAVTLAGILLLIRMVLRERLPYTTPRQAERGLRVAVTSIPLVFVTLAHLGLTIAWIVQSTNGMM